MRTLLLFITTIISLSAWASEKVKIEVGLGYSVCYGLPMGCAYTIEPQAYEIKLSAQDELGLLSGKLRLTFKTIHNRHFKATVHVTKFQPEGESPEYSVNFKFWDTKHPSQKAEGAMTVKDSLANFDTVTLYGNKINTSEFEMRPELFLRSTAQ